MLGLPQFQTAIRIMAAAAVLWVGWIFLNRHFMVMRGGPTADPQQAKRTAEFMRIYGGKDVKILQFYVREGSVAEGAGTVLCYGVLNAKSVRIEPPVEGVTVSLNKCVEVTGERDTRYTLYAEGTDGQVASESFVLSVHPDEFTLPRITSFAVQSRSIDYRGHPVYLVGFTAENPEEVSIDPPAFPALHRSPYGRFYVAPEKTTTYTLTVTGKRGHKDQKQLKLEGPGN